MTKTVLVAGANGFVGSHTLAALQAMGDIQLIALVRDRNRLPADFTGEIRQGDIRDGAFLQQALHGVDSVCVATAWTSAWGHRDASRQHLLQPTLAFMDACVEQGIGRIVFPSSTSVRVLRGMQGKGIDPDSIWPHMANVMRIEDHMRQLAGSGASMVSLRLGLFAGEGYGLGMLPILLPRLRSHLVPWVGKGRPSLPLTAGQDIGRAMALAAVNDELADYVEMDVVGPEIPTAREVFRFLREAYGYPLPHFGVSFPMAYGFAHVMETLSKLTPWDPFISRSVVLLLEETAASNRRAGELLGYQPQIHWRDAIRAQLAEMQRDRVKGLPMARPLPQPLIKTGSGIIQ